VTDRVKAVVVHAGARDSYQVALALKEAGLLDSLITDLFWPVHARWARYLHACLPASLKELALRRSASSLPFSRVHLCALSGMRCLLLEKIPGIPFEMRRKSIRAMDAVLGRTAGRRARKSGAGLLSYSYCGYDALKEYGEAAMLFQAHPHPSTMRAILREELALHPDCESSLAQEWELALPEQDYQHLVAETHMASHYLVASSFTKRSLVEHGTAPASVTVIPYGVDLHRFHPATAPDNPAEAQPLRLLFVGRINQRKGVKYLLEALRLLGPANLHLTVCGRVVDDLSLFKPFAEQVTIRPSVTADELVAVYREADLFVFPSIAEGFGQVLLEALASGLPILSTTHTAAPDLIEDGVQGFIVEPRRPDLIAERIAWALTHRHELAEMKLQARLRAELFTWDRFRSGVASAVQDHLIAHPPAQYGASRKNA
jgi:glycosyltransferase involved in cell wall biosynthesis